MKKLITLTILGLMMVPAIAQKYTGPVMFGPVVLDEGTAKVGSVDTLFGNFFNSQPAIYTSNNGGYVSGNNGYEDIAKAEQFSVTTPYSVTGVALWFGAASYNSFSPTSGVMVNLYRMDGSGFNASGSGFGPGTIERSVFLPMSDIILNGTEKNIITFPVPFNASSNYLIGIDLITLAPQDTVALYTTTDGGGDMDDHAWEQFDDGDWYTFLASGSWGMDVDYAIFPIVDYNTTGIIRNETAENGISKATLNPSIVKNSTKVNFELNGAYGNVILEIVDLKGQSKMRMNVGKLSKGAYQYDMDLSALPNGLYTCRISAGAYIRSSKLVISH